jgi:hypothetical protein
MFIHSCNLLEGYDEKYTEEVPVRKFVKNGLTVCVTGAGADGAKPSDWKNDKA